MQEEVTYELRGEVAYIKLNRPAALNAFNPPMFDAFNAATDRFRDDPAAKVAIVHAEGPRAFCAGVDLKHLGADLATGAPRKPYAIHLAEIGYLDKPVVAAIHGFCVGEGVHLALACDFRVAASDATFLVPEVAVGIPLIRLSSQCVRMIGMPAAVELCLLCERKDSAWALANSLVHKVAAPGEEMAVAEKIAAKLCDVSFDALRITKQTLARAHDMTYQELLAFGLPLRAEVFRKGDARKAAQAFVARGDANDGAGSARSEKATQG